MNQPKFKAAVAGLLSKLKQLSDKAEANGLELEYSVRFYDFDPFHKGLIFNKKAALWNIYPLRQDLLLHGGGVWDCEGANVNLIEFRDDTGRAQAEVVRSIAGWFEILWKNLSHEATLTNIK